MRLSKITFIALVIVFIVSCNPANNITKAQISEKLLSFPAGYYTDVVYLDNKVIGFIYDIDDKPNDLVIQIDNMVVVSGWK